MNFIINISHLSGEVRIPASKSHTIRGLICGTLAKGKSVLKNPLLSEDTIACLNACKKFGAGIKVKNNNIFITGTGGGVTSPDDIIDVMNSGTTLYFLMGLASIIDGWTFFTGDKQITNRPAGEMMKALHGLKAKAFSSRGNEKAPLAIRGKAHGGKISIHAKSSQYLSSILLSAPLYPKKTNIKVLLLNERPYVDMTIEWLKLCGIKVRELENDNFEIFPNQKYNNFQRTIPADFSSAAFFIAASALFAKDEVTIKGLDINDVQGDKAIIDILRRMNAVIKFKNKKLIIRKSTLTGINIDISDTPDLLPILSVLACFASGKTVIYNGEHVREKETDRISVMTKELKKMGAKIKETKDGMIITGTSLKGAHLNGHVDHRVIMSLAIAALGCKDASTIKGSDAVSVTFPNFFELIRSIGAKIRKA
ncbi:MAG: 3-phosphoshikimate 1-carboxyvinyltransferase [Candidatus Aureabacteria bacterium]|nr:3-phosphoshikimate 1-carboxyvinyltransferase [Candidatus Auribacterota bacterium]